MIVPSDQRSQFGISFRVNECSVPRFFDSTEGKRRKKKKKVEKSFELSITREPEASNFIRIRSAKNQVRCVCDPFFSSFRSTRGNEFLCAAFRVSNSVRFRVKIETRAH